MIFTPAKTRDGLRRLLTFTLSTKHEADRPMGNVAQSELEDVIRAWLVGLDTEIAPVLLRALEWLDRAISEDENFGTSRNFHRLKLHWAKALGLWMRDGVNVPTAWDATRQFSVAALEHDSNVWPSNHIDKDRLDDYMALCFQAEQYEIGIAEFEKYWGVRLLSLKKTLAPRELGYALCLHKARQQFDEIALFDAGRKMLQAKLEKDWLVHGHTTRAATWLKIVYWCHDPALTPLQVILRAYDNMPKVPRPEFLGA